MFASFICLLYCICVLIWDSTLLSPVQGCNEDKLLMQIVAWSNVVLLLLCIWRIERIQFTAEFSFTRWIWNCCKKGACRSLIVSSAPRVCEIGMHLACTGARPSYCTLITLSFTCTIHTTSFWPCHFYHAQVPCQDAPKLLKIYPTNPLSPPNLPFGRLFQTDHNPSGSNKTFHAEAIITDGLLPVYLPFVCMSPSWSATLYASLYACPLAFKHDSILSNGIRCCNFKKKHEATSRLHRESQVHHHCSQTSWSLRVPLLTRSYEYRIGDKFLK